MVNVSIKLVDGSFIQPKMTREEFEILKECVTKGMGVVKTTNPFNTTQSVYINASHVVFFTLKEEK